MASQHNGCHVQPRGKGFFRRRLQKMVKAVLSEEEQSTISCSYWNFIIDRHNSIISKVVWVCVTLSCIGLFGYQTYDRISYYLIHPVSVNGFITKRSLQTFPHLTICYQETKGFFEISRHFGKDYCRNNVIMEAVTLPGNLTMEEVWEKMNTTTAVVSAKGISPESIMPLDISEKRMMFGVCTTFSQRSNMPLPVDGGRYEIVLRKYSGNCATYSSINVYLHDESRSLTAHTRRELQLGKKHDIGVAIRKVHFVNRAQSPCLSAEEAEKCEENCFAAFLMQKLKCSFPFFPAKVKLNPCKNGTENEWYTAHNYLSGTDIGNPPCSCTRKCMYRSFNEKYTYSMNYDNQSIVTLHLSDSYETLIQEALSYSFVDLLSTIGGNSGLYIGASVLSVVQLLTAAFALKTKRKPHKFTLASPLFRKVVKTYRDWKRTNIRMKPYAVPGERKITTAFKLSAIVVCAFWLFTVVNRVSYFLDYPSKIFIDIAFNVTLAFPGLTICAGNPNVTYMQKLIANAKNELNFCEVKVWELFDFPEHNIASIIWENKSLKPLSHADLHTAVFDGTCIDYPNYGNADPGHHLKWFYESLPHGSHSLCGTNYMKVYVNDALRRHDYFQYRYFVTGTMAQLTFVIKEIRLDSSIDTCVSDKRNDVCIDRCLAKKLFHNITCRLPYMPASISLPPCTTSHSAKNSHLKYMEVYMSPINSLNCECLPKCLTRIYETQMGSEPFGIAVIILNAANNVVESYKKVRTYSVVQLICDIGGLLGSLLGLSVITTAELVLKYAQNRCKKTKRKPIRILVRPSYQ